MPSYRMVLASALLLATALPASAYMHARRGPTSPSLFKKRSTRSTIKPSGPRAMDSDRATQIQAALIKGGYMTGTPSGHWDADSQAAMQKLQGANGWQTKLTPDSRALILLGLGPNNTVTASAARPEVSQSATPVSVPETYAAAFASQK